MKKIFAIAMAFAFVAVSTVAFAQEKKAEEKKGEAKPAAAAPAKAEKKAEHPGEPAKAEKKAAKKAKAHQVTGSVKAVDAKANTLTVVKKVKKEEKEVVLSCTDKTKFKGVKGLADVKAGDKVTAKYSEKDGKNVASSVDVKAAPAKKEEKKAEKKEAAPAKKEAAPAPAPAPAPAKK
ncbi:MAG: hypothetical protein A2V83_00190 [Nitrospirae bacterium RBG_16_64_22]|nr:MAG: hypothetical protein A2V83_00190 [Nitrospirae bacterium RBG_16_64_22]